MASAPLSSGSFTWPLSNRHDIDSDSHTAGPLGDRAPQGAWLGPNLLVHRGLGIPFLSPPQGLSEVLTHPEGAGDPTMLGTEPETEGGQQCLGWLGQTWGFQGKTKRCWVSEGQARVDYARFTFGALIVIIFFSPSGASLSICFIWK